ncbi:MAG TPA: hypothetical protein VGR95_00640 [Thermoanaerobaculia bacterium]|nr:hypothetical protein [Thermoanaerobaculia bacterium]
MRRLLLLSFLLVGARAAFAVTCGGFSIVTADHIVVKYSAPVATGATRSNRSCRRSAPTSRSRGLSPAARRRT